MANYECHTRTNYFHVTDAEKFEDLMSRCSTDDKIKVWMKTDKLDRLTYAFGAYGQLRGLREYDLQDDDESLRNFLKELSNLIEPGDACIISSSGYEKLNYVAADAWVVTSKTWQFYSFDDFVFEKTCELLENPHWTTDPDY